MADPAVLVGGGGAAAAAAAGAVEMAVPTPNEQAAVGPAEGESVAAVVGGGQAATACDPHEGRKGATRAGTVKKKMVVPRRCLPTKRGCVDGVSTVRKARLKSALFLIGASLLTVVFVRLAERVNQESCSRGHVLIPGDSPLLPGQCIEGRTGNRRLGFLPGLSWTPRLEVRAGGEMVVTRPNGSEVLLAGSVSEDKGKTGVLCKTERLVRGVARMGTPMYGARSRLGQLVLGQERFCGVNASAATISSRSLAKIWRDGGGILGFTENGDLEMVTPSGDVVWSYAEGGGVDEIREQRRTSEKASKELMKAKGGEERWKRLARIEKDLSQSVKRRKRGREKQEVSRNNKKDGAKTNTCRRKRASRWNDGAVSEAATDITATTAEGSLHGWTAFLRVFSWGRPSPKGDGG